MGSRSPQRFFDGSTPNDYRLSDGLHKIPSAITLWSCEMTDLSPTGYTNNHGRKNSHHQLQQHLYQQYQHHNQLFAENANLNSSSDNVSNLSISHRHYIPVPTTVSNNNNSTSSNSYSSHHYRRDHLHHRDHRDNQRTFFLNFSHESDKERKRHEPSFFNLGFRRKSFYAATD